MKEISTSDAGKDDLLDLARYNDVLDIFLFLIGFFLPLGDYFESIVGGSFDLLLLIWMYPIIRRNAIWLFILECIDLTDLITVGWWDVLGWIELFPFWYFYYKDFTIEMNIKEKKLALLENSNVSKLSAAQNTPKPTIETEQNCPECGNKIPFNSKVCELCGAKLKKRK